MSDDKVKMILTRPALERLISGEPGLEVELKHAAVKEIFDKHLAEVLRNHVVDSIVKGAKATVSDEIEKYLGKFVQEGSGWYAKMKFEPTASTKQAIQDYVQEATKELIQFYLKEANLTRIINETVHTTVQFTIKEEVKKRLKEVMTQVEES